MKRGETIIRHKRHKILHNILFGIARTGDVIYEMEWTTKAVNSVWCALNIIHVRAVIHFNRIKH
ncbi:UNVERIFIED_CONTAM: hypothetical protein NCL1_07629 [Trichonephila clavipes]